MKDNENQVISQTTQPKVRSPWRRYFARSLDLLIYSVIWGMTQAIVLNVNTDGRSLGRSLINNIMISLLMIFIEPLLLVLFGTTMGKFVLGLKVVGKDNQRLSYAEGLSRTWKVFIKGLGLNIPIYNLVRLWKSYKDCDEGFTLDWEEDTIIILRDKKAWRVGAYMAAIVLVLAVTNVSAIVSGLPKNRGDISVAEFCENYNQYVRYFNLDYSNHLSDTGEWVQNENINNSLYIGDYIEPEIAFTEENGVMTGLDFKVKMMNGDSWTSNYQEEMILCILSYAYAQKDVPLLSNEFKKWIGEVEDSQFEDFQFMARDILVTCHIKNSGYTEMEGSDILIPTEEGKDYFLIEFSMKKN